MPVVVPGVSKTLSYSTHTITLGHRNYIFHGQVSENLSSLPDIII